MVEFCWSEAIIERETHSGLGIVPLVLPDSRGGADPGIIGGSLPGDQASLEGLQVCLVGGEGSHIGGLLRVLLQIIELPLVSVVVVLQALEPVGGLSFYRTVQKILL